jgi:hypothetical protein
MGRSRKHDVFVIGDEQLAAETTALPDEDPEAPLDAQEPDGTFPSGLDRPLPSGAGASRSSRRLTLLGIGTVAGAALALLELSSSGGAAHRQRPETSAPTALVQRPAPRVTVPPASAARPSFHARPTNPGQGPAARARQAANRSSEPERETSQEPAPVRSPLPPPAPPLSSVPAPSPPSPPLPGGGSAGEERFGFER